MQRPARLAAAPRWLASYTGKRVVLGYARWFGVDRACAILELRMLGIAVPEAEVTAAAAALGAAQARRARVRAKAAASLSVEDVPYEDLEDWGFEGGGEDDEQPFEED